MNAGLSLSTSDDLAMLQSALAGADSFFLSSDADRARGYGGNDLMFGYGGSDILYGSSGADRIEGGGGGDTLYGESDSDKLFGGASADQIYAGTGSDTLVGGAGQDRLYGGTDSARDIFVFNSRSDSAVGAMRDVIHNFTRSVDDIDLRAIDARAATAGSDEAFLYSGDTAKAYSVWWKSSSTGVIVQADVNGDKAPDFEIRVAGLTSFGSGDFLL